VNSLLKSISQKATNAGEFVTQLKETGLNSAHDLVAGIPLFGALSANTEEDVIYDETHYVLVPLVGSGGKNAVYTKRVLPPDVGADNSLPKCVPRLELFLNHQIWLIV